LCSITVLCAPSCPVNSFNPVEIVLHEVQSAASGESSALIPVQQ